MSARTVFGLLILTTLTGAILLNGPGWLRADDLLPTTEDDPPKVPAEKPDARRDRLEKDLELDDALDDRVERALTPRHPEPSAVEELERAISGMRTASRRIEERDLSANTVDLQRQVLKDLETVLAQLKRQKSPPPSSSEQDQKPTDPKDGHEKASGQRAGKNRPEKTPESSQNADGANRKPKGGQGSPSRSEAEKARESSERQEARRSAADDDRRQKMIKDVWGHLPPHLREAMLNSFSEKYLPEYEELVKRYYEALAEKNRKRSGN